MIYDTLKIDRMVQEKYRFINFVIFLHFTLKLK